MGIFDGFFGKGGPNWNYDPGRWGGFYQQYFNRMIEEDQRGRRFENWRFNKSHDIYRQHFEKYRKLANRYGDFAIETLKSNIADQRGQLASAAIRSGLSGTTAMSHAQAQADRNYNDQLNRIKEAKYGMLRDAENRRLNLAENVRQRQFVPSMAPYYTLMSQLGQTGAFAGPPPSWGNTQSGLGQLGGIVGGIGGLFQGLRGIGGLFGSGGGFRGYQGEGWNQIPPPPGGWYRP